MNQGRGLEGSDVLGGRSVCWLQRGASDVNFMITSLHVVIFQPKHNSDVFRLSDIRTFFDHAFVSNLRKTATIFIKLVT